jgi:xylose dehydrogenase (NAD/NADP)
VRSGAIGRLRMIRAAFGFPLGDDANVRLSTELEGGALMDVGCYCLSAARLLAGEPEVVSGHQVTGGDGVDALFVGSMRFAGDVLAHFDAGFTVAARDELEVVGDQATLFLDDPWHCVDPVIERRDGRSVESIAVAPVNSYRLEAENLSAAIRGRAKPLLGRADAVGQARAIEALYQAAASGCAVELAHG